jgi:hypothetical protein
MKTLMKKKGINPLLKLLGWLIVSAVVPRALEFEGMTAHSIGISMFFFGLFGYVLWRGSG